MCGIAGVINPKINNKEEVIGEMTSAIYHRGPDDDGFFVDSNVGLGMRRLSIIDLTTGRQPITSLDDRFVIFFNGEIYNYKELRAELTDANYTFKTNTDTEVILRLYEIHGEKMLTKLRGMFAICIYDTETKHVFLARDYFGIKPLYYLLQDEKIVAFGSEVKSFASVPGYTHSVNDSAVYNYLSFQYNPLTETFFKNVYKLPPGHYLKVDTSTGVADIKKYWSFEFAQDKTLDIDRTTKKIKGVVKDSVAHHMIADVPVGAFLSGGVDSSIITTLMQEIRGDKKIKTFTVGFDTLTEALEAKETSDFLGTDHTEIKIGSEEYFSVLTLAAYHFDEPVADPSAIGLYFVAREARKHVKVVLSGEGSDELFGGYNIYLAPLAKAKMSWLPKSVLNFFIGLPFEYFGKNYLRRVSQKLEDWYFGQKYFSKSIFDRAEIEKIWKGAPQKFVSLKSLYAKKGNSDSTQMQYVDINTWLVGDILAKADKMTMANSLELRVPFLDKDVADIARTLPDSFKWSKGITKYLLREAFSSVIPESTRNRKKLGFPTPIKSWLTADNHFVYDTILDNEYIQKSIDLDFVEKLIDDQISQRTDNSRKIYTLLMLALWYNCFIKK